MSISLFTLASSTPISTAAGVGIQDLIQRVTDILFALAYPIAFIALVVTAWRLISSAGDPAAYATARKNITYIIMGIAILTLGFYVIKLIYTIFSQAA